MLDRHDQGPEGVIRGDGGAEIALVNQNGDVVVDGLAIAPDLRQRGAAQLGDLAGNVLGFFWVNPHGKELLIGWLKGPLQEAHPLEFVDVEDGGMAQVENQQIA